MPTLADGRVEVDAACQWISQHVDCGHSGWDSTRKASPAVGTKPLAPDHPPEISAVPLPQDAERRQPQPGFQPRATEISASLPTTSPVVGGDPGRVLLLAKAKKALAELRHIERIEQHAAGELIPRAAVVEYVTTLSFLLRDAALAQPDRLANHLAGASDQAEIYRILRADGHALLEKLSRAIRDADPAKQTVTAR